MFRRTAIASVAAACALPVTGARGQGLAPLRVGVLQGDSSAEPLFAQRAGIFARAGINADIQHLPGGAAAIAAIAGGALDVGFSNVVSAAAAITRNVPIVMIAPATIFSSKSPDVLLYKARGSALKTGADLNGKTVAVTSLAGLLSVGASAWIDKTGGDAKSVKFVELVFSEMASALRQKRIDAAMISEPLATEARADIEPLGDAFGAIAPEFLIGSFVASKAWLDANGELARRFAAAIIETARFANTNRSATAKMLAESDKLDPSTLATMARASFGDTVSAALLTPPLDASLRYGALKAQPDVAALIAAGKPYWSSARRSS